MNFSLVSISSFQSWSSEELQVSLYPWAVSLSSACSSSLCVDALDFQAKACVSPRPGMEAWGILRRQNPGQALRRLESSFLWWLSDGTCYLLIVGGLGVRAAALLQLLPPLSECSIQVTEITWKPLQRRRPALSIPRESVRLDPTYQVEVR